MPPAFATYIGVDTAAGRKPFTYIALDSSRKLLAVGAGGMVEVLSFAFGQSSTILALSPRPHPYRGAHAHPESGLVAVGSYLMQQELALPIEAGVPRNPPSGCPFWLKTSFCLADQLEGLGFHMFPDEEASRQWLETQCEAGFHKLLGMPPFIAGTLEGRIQRQLALDNLDLNVPDPMTFFEEITRYRLLHGVLPDGKVLPQGELNAWLAAQVAWAAANAPQTLHAVGSQPDRPIYLPVAIE